MIKTMKKKKKKGETEITYKDTNINRETMDKNVQ
jgi:hypothetical protein